MFVSAYGGEGVSSCAREYARCEAAFAKRPVWLIDADLRQQEQLASAIAQPKRFGHPGPLNQASPDGHVFFSISPKLKDQNGSDRSDAEYLVARPFFDGRLWITHFREQALQPRQRVKIHDQPGYWAALKQHAQTIIVDAPALERSDHGLKLLPHMDGVILVVSEDTGDVQQRLKLKADIEAKGGRILGLFYNRANNHAPQGSKSHDRGLLTL